MIGRKKPQQATEVVSGPKGFDDYEMRLGDTMRGERATLGKSLLDVQRELRIKAAYISAIENCDPSAFDTPGFIAGYVRSYARYLGMDPESTFDLFCRESGFATAHGMAAEASSIKRSDPFSETSDDRTTTRMGAAPLAAAAAAPLGRDPFSDPKLPFTPGGESWTSRIEAGAIGSTLVLVLLLGGIGYGGWSVLNEIQKVQLAPVEQTPVALTELDPLDGARPATRSSTGDGAVIVAGATEAPEAAAGALDRLYRPQALDVPVLVARDAPISSLDPSQMGTFPAPNRDATPDLSIAALEPDPFAIPLDGSRAAGQTPGQTVTLAGAGSVPKVLEDWPPGVTLVAVRTAWVRVRAADRSVMFEGMMNAGDTYAVPQTEDPATIRIGESGAVYFGINGETYGPAGRSGQVVSRLALSVDNLTASYEVADLDADGDLERVIAELRTGLIDSGN